VDSRRCSFSFLLLFSFCESGGFVDEVVWQELSLSLNLFMGGDTHAKEAMPVLPAAVLAARAELPSTEGVREGVMPGLENQEEVEEMEPEEPIVWAKPEGQAQRLEAGASGVLESLAQESSGLCGAQPQAAEGAGRQKKWISCKTNRLERDST
jgi:hypothetical protein